MRTLFSGVFALLGFGLGIRPLSDNSFLWHLRAGQWILDHGIPHHDPFSYTAAGRRWVAQSWLAEITYAALERTVGAVGIRVFNGLVGALIGLLVFRLAVRLVRDRVIGAAITLAALAGICTLWSERPLLVGVLFFVVLIWIVEVPDSAVGRHPIALLPVLMWLWVNVHGTFALGFLYLALHLVGRWLDGASPFVEGPERRLLIGGVVAFAVLFVNPYGVALVTFPIELLARSDALAYIVEWRSPDFRQASGLALAVWLGVYIFAIARGRHRVSRRDLVVSVPMIFLALWALRNVALAPLVGLPVAARALAHNHERPDPPHPAVARAAAAMLLVLALGVGVRALSYPDFTFSSRPVKALRFMERNGLLGHHILNTDPDGGYIILEYFPTQRVFIDDRFDMYPRRVISDYVAIAKGGPEWQHILDRYDIDVVVWPPRTALSSLLDESARWERVHRDRQAGVWVRRPLAG